jgi:hypothetical protein
MSASLKIFFDCLTDLTENYKAQGKSLKGKQAWVIASGTEEILPEGFEVPFRRTRDYFGMIYRGAAYLYTGSDTMLRARSESEMTKFGAAI